MSTSNPSSATDPPPPPPPDAVRDLAVEVLAALGPAGNLWGFVDKGPTYLVSFRLPRDAHVRAGHFAAARSVDRAAVASVAWAKDHLRLDVRLPKPEAAALTANERKRPRE